VTLVCYIDQKEIIMNRTTRILNIDGFDFFAFLLPGLVVLFAAIAALILGFDKSIEDIHGIVLSSSITAYITVLLLIVVIGYIAGHFSGALSVMILDRNFVQKIVKYPYEKLLFSDSYNIHNPKSCIHRIQLSLVSLSILFFCLRWLDDFFIFAGLCTLSILVLLTLIKIIDSTAISFRLWSAYSDEYPSISKYTAIAYKALSIPSYAIENLIRKSWGLDKSFPPEITAFFIQLFTEKFNITPEKKLKTDVYWLPFFYVMENSESARCYLQKLIQNFAFLRNLSAALMIAAILISIPEPTNIFHIDVYIIALVLISMSLFMSIRYYYFYYNIFSKAVFRLFICIASEKENIPDPERNQVEIYRCKYTYNESPQQDDST